MNCNVCGRGLGEPIFESPSPIAITSLGQIVPMSLRVWLCEECSHLRGVELPDTENFYESEYRISLGSEEEDQVYEVIDEEVIFRNDFQLTVLLRKIEIAKNSRVLDYGCAKASMMRALVSQRQGVEIHLFDVSQMYKSFWTKLAPPDRWAIGDTPAAWQGSMDLVTSFFAFEHMPEPTRAAQHIFDLLRPGGMVYAVVPYLLSNIGDMIVADHVNHFTIRSLGRLFAGAGFGEVEVSADEHRGALIVVAKKGGLRGHTPSPMRGEMDAAKLVARYWRRAAMSLRSDENLAGDSCTAIYGAGFYGAYVYSTLMRPDRVHCFLDRNHFLHGRQAFGRPILAPEALPDEIKTLLVGLEPKMAADVVGGFPDIWRQRLTIITLPEAT